MTMTMNLSYAAFFSTAPDGFPFKANEVVDVTNVGIQVTNELVIDLIHIWHYYIEIVRQFCEDTTSFQLFAWCEKQHHLVVIHVLLGIFDEYIPA